jgi:fused signal recognition particle receptor
MDIIERVSKKSYQIKHAADLKAILKEEISAIIDTFAPPPQAAETRPHVIMVVGVNGVGKTTTIGKLAARYAESGKKVLIGASDTFRAAAIEQLSVWADRSGSQIVRHRDHADPAAVAFDAVDAAIARKADVVLIDTAGRLHTKVNLMEELKKIKRSLAKRLPEAPHETLLVLDATTGQNALSQAALFNDAIELSGLALTKLDGTAKGGIVVSICSTLNIPLLYIGVGEQLEDLQAFDPERFVDALF